MLSSASSSGQAKEATIDAGYSVAAGELLLGLTLLTALAGRFSFDRLGMSPVIDVRMLGLFAATIYFLAWSTASRPAVGRGTSGPSFAPLAALSGWLVLSTMWALPGARIGAGVADAVSLALVVGLTVAVARRLPSRSLNRIWSWTFYVAGIYLAVALLAGPGPQGRYSVVGGGPNIFARVMLLGGVAAIARAILSNRSRWLLALPLFLTGLVLSGSRGAAVSGLATGIIFTIPLLRRFSRRLRWIGVVVLALATLAVLAFAGDMIEEVLYGRFVEAVQTADDSYRLLILQQSLELFSGSPILGVGLDGLHASGSMFEYAHNLVVGAMVEGGLVALVLLSIQLLFIVRVLLLHRPLSTEAVLFLAAGTVVFFASMFTGDFYDTRFMWIMLGISGVLAARASSLRTLARGRQAR